MHLDMPIQQVVRRTDTRFQYGFAREAKALMPESREFVLETSRIGLVVLGRNEDALAPPVETLREIYGRTLEVQPPAVRLIHGVQVREPIMHVRIAMQTKFRAAVRQAMLARAATAAEDYTRANYCVVHYQAPLERLLGLPNQLRALTAGTARHWIALSHYALVIRDPGGDAA
jgi:predicted membrane GTPase involved in stress response